MAQERNFTLDFLRSVAIILMINTHVAFFWYNYTTPWVNWFADLGGWICLSLFLFVSGGTLFYLEKHRLVKSLPQRFVVRALTIYMVLVVLTWYGSRSTHLERILVGSLTVPLVDFLWLFVWVFLVTAVFIFAQRKLPILINSWFLGVFVVVMYGVGLLGYQLVDMLPITLRYGFSFLVGYGDWHRFPLLQYGSLYVLGFLWMRYRTSFRWWNYATITLVSGLGYWVLSHLMPFDRWSVNPTFLLFSITSISLLLTIATVLPRFHGFFKHLLTLLSSLSLPMLVIHTALIFTITRFWVDRFTAIPAVLASITIILTSMVIGWAWKQLFPNSRHHS